MPNFPAALRKSVHEVFQCCVTNEQYNTASRVFDVFDRGANICVVLAEMHSGSLNIAIALAGMFRLQLSDANIADPSKLKSCLYVVTSDNVALRKRVELHFSSCNYIDVLGRQSFEKICGHHSETPPDLIIVDESHYGHASESVSYDEISHYIKHIDRKCKLAVISSTPFAALHSVSLESMALDHARVGCVAHFPQESYVGIRHLLNGRRIVDLQKWERKFSNNTMVRQQFLRKYQCHDGPGWVLIRSTGRSVESTVRKLVESHVEPEDIYVVGTHVSDKGNFQVMDENAFLKAFRTLMLFEKKLCVVTVAGFQPGVELNGDMARLLIATWDSTNATVAAVVNSSVGVGCGFSHNTKAIHFTSRKALLAYSSILDYFYQNGGSTIPSDMHRIFEKLCYQYDVDIFNRGDYSYNFEELVFDAPSEYNDFSDSDSPILGDRADLDINPYIDIDDGSDYESRRLLALDGAVESHFSVGQVSLDTELIPLLKIANKR